MDTHLEPTGPRPRVPVDVRQAFCLSDVNASTVLGHEHPCHDLESGLLILGLATGELVEKAFVEFGIRACIRTGPIDQETHGLKKRKGECSTMPSTRAWSPGNRHKTAPLKGAVDQQGMTSPREYLP